MRPSSRCAVPCNLRWVSATAPLGLVLPLLLATACGGDAADSNGAAGQGAGATAGAGGTSGGSTGGSEIGGGETGGGETGGGETGGGETGGGEAGGGETGGGETGGGETGGEAGVAGSAGSTAATCPPTGPYGTKTGDVAPNVTLYDCDGNPVVLHDTCALDGVYVYTFAGWCTTCQAFASSGQPNDIYEEYKDDSFDMLFVVTAPGGTGAPTRDDCANVRDKYGLGMKVLFDPDGVAHDTLGMKVNSGDMVLSRGAVIEVNTGDVAMAEDTLRDLLGH